ncbi:hypothetical protein Taro_004238 [Colocasia esculenta]|uniref:Uncharacterized protein n=1 Tax=Colocasia esculenta TaxID=4460 RepID=A0A843TNZ7_COLES|nr:hypothetical protein [Colocasia esculenta]
MRVTTGSTENATWACTDRNSLVSSGRQVATGHMRVATGLCLCRDGPENAAYQAVAFLGTSPEFEREKD